MCDYTDDILQEIPENDLLDLALLYGQTRFLEWATYAYNTIQSVIRWKKMAKYWKDVRIYSPQCPKTKELYWKYDGTIVIMMTYCCYDIFVFTLCDDTEALYHSLTNTKRINWQRDVIFIAVHEKHLSTVNRVIEEKELALVDDKSFKECVLYVMDVDSAKNQEIMIPKSVEVKKIRSKLRDTVHDIWPERQSQPQRYLTTIMEVNGGYGIFLRETKKLVCWIPIHVMTHIGAVQEHPDYRDKGYDLLVTKIMAKDIAERGFCPVAAVVKKDTKTRDYFEALGFEEKGECYFIRVIKKPPAEAFE